MNRFIKLLTVLLFLAIPTFAWNCPAGQIRQQAPTGTPTTAPYYDVVEGIAFICVPSTPTTGTTSNNASSTSNSASNSASASNSNSSATGGSAVANGGSAKSSSTASGGSATGGNATGGSVGPISNVNKAQGGAGGAGGQGGTASATAGNSSSGSGNSTNINETTNVAADRIPVNTAYAGAPYPTAQCFKGYGLGGQTAPFGFSVNGGKIDENCAILETARSFDSVGERLAACKVKISNKYAKNAGVTLEDCLKASEPVAVAQPPAPAPTPIIVNLPAPVINVSPAPVTIQQMPPAQTPAPVFVAPKPHRKIKPPAGSGIKPCPVGFSKTDICLEND